MTNDEIADGESWIARRVFPLNEKWKFKEASDSSWLPVAQFPTNVHLDLLHHGKIPDPFLEQNETAVQWVGEKVWIYCTEFDVPRFMSAKQRMTLVLEGLDTFATVVLNGSEILRSNDMFIPKRVDVSNMINLDGNNTIEITFDSTWLIGKKLQEQYPDHFWGCWNGDCSRLAVRKAQYHYGWDWGPTLLTAGPWRPVYLERYSARLDDLYFTMEVADSLQAAKIVAKADCEGVCTSVVFELCLGEVLVERRTAEVVDAHAEITFMLVNPQLWYPATYGEQPLYHLKATLFLDGKRLDTISKRLGIRKAVVVQREVKDAPGTSFFFEINNIPIFCGGSNWIPADNFVPRISEDRYRSWLRLIRDGNQIMVRAWGGGIFEEQAFYDAADELGILIWQDFLFACGNYPGMISEFRETVKEEARSNVKRLRHHPSIVIYAGNNEDYQFQESDNPDYDPDDPDPESWLKSSFPARYIYEVILVDVMKELAPGTHYHFGSPYGGKTTKDPTVGDIHQWNVWHGGQRRYQDFDKLSGRFISEFGMQSFPDIRTIDSFLPRDTTDRYPQSSTMDFHDKAAGHERRLALYLVENLRCTFEPIEQYIYLTQLMQAECLSTAYRVWRRNWKGPGREYTAGVLVWQINDCWPTISWAIVDYYLRPKLAYYAIKQCLAPVTVAAKCVEHESPRDPYTRVGIDRESRVYVWASNLRLTPLQSKLQIKAFDVTNGEQIYQRTEDAVVLQENRSTELTDFLLPTTTKIGEDTNRVVVAVYLLDLTGTQIARFVLWPEILKYVKVQKPKHLKVEFTGDCVSASVEVPVKGLTFEEDGAVFEDNLIDLVPGETVSVKVKGLDGQRNKMAVRYYGM